MSGDQLSFGDDERSVTLKRAWDRALGILAGKVSKVTFESYIRSMRVVSSNDEAIVLAVPSAFAREWIEKRHGALLRGTLATVLGRPVEVEYKVVSADERQPAVQLEPQAPLLKKRPRKEEPSSFVSLPISPKFSFDGFVVGRSNRLAHAGALAVADDPGGVYNPLFIYGGSGLGKTHLLHAIGNALLEADASRRVVLIDGESFTHQFVGALRERKMEEFRRHFRSVDVWLVDDVQFIAGREQTNEEFFHTYNALYHSGKQIVVCSDRSPRELRAMDERLRSRFEAGLIADVHSPELETRVAILERRCAVEGWKVPTEVVFHVASAIQSNMRALEGALTKLVAYHSIMRTPIDIDLAQTVLGEFFIEQPGLRQTRKAITIEVVQRAVCERLQTSPDALISQRREAAVVAARQVAMYLCRELTQAPLSHIGVAFGGRNHTTVQRAVARVENLLLQDAQLQAVIRELRGRLES